MHIMIRNFRDPETARLFQRQRSRQLPANIHARALRKLVLLHAAESLDELRIPPGNRLDPLRGDREGQHSIRITERWRLCFRWQHGDAYDVEIVDYH